MTEGHDGVDDRPTDEEAGGGRDREGRSGTDRERAWPGEDDDPASGRAGADEPSGTAGQGTRSVQERSSEPSRERGAPTGQAVHPDRDGSVEITDSQQSDGNWIDLSEHAPGGEALAAADLTEEKLAEYTTDRRSLASLVQVHWGVRVTVGALVTGLVATWGLGALGVDQQFGAALVGLFVVTGLVWVVLYYRLWVYQVRADAIYMERGVVTHVRTLVPYVRIQHVDTSRSPIERMLGLSTLVVYTAGSRGADVSIPGLRPEEARDLQRRVKELAIEAEGDDAL